jgi:6-phosphogluconolactonase
MEITRRLFAFLFVLCAPLVLFSSVQLTKIAAPITQYLVYVGTYTTKTKSKGIYAYRFDSATCQLSPIGLAAETSNPSFLVVHPSGKYLYAVNELDNFHGAKNGALSAYAIDRKSGKLMLLNQVASRGAGPCYVSLDKTGKYVLVANYDSGSVASFPLREDGSLGPAGGFAQHVGSGPNKESQQGPHAHWIETSPDNRFAVVVDLGLDEVLVYRFDAAKGTLTPNDTPFVSVNPGAGPRHFAFHPSGKFGYVLNEIESTVTSFSYEPASGILSPLQTLTTLPKDFTGHDSIAVFAIDADTGKLTRKGYVPTGGKTPRHFAIDPTGKYLLAENQESNNIVVFKIDSATGGLSPAIQVVEAPLPVALTFVPAE